MYGGRRNRGAGVLRFDIVCVSVYGVCVGDSGALSVEHTRALATVLGFVAQHGFHGNDCRDCTRYLRTIQLHLERGADQRAVLIGFFRLVPPVEVPLQFLVQFEYSILREFIKKRLL